MPTGSGKTAFLMMVPFVLRSTRVFVIIPSIMVRGQIYDDFQWLATLTEIGVLPVAIENPHVVEVSKRITTDAAWEVTPDFRQQKNLRVKPSGSLRAQLHRVLTLRAK
jgi:reverse gyrase